MNDRTEDTATSWLPSIEAKGKIQATLNDFRRAELRHVMSTDDKAMIDIDRGATKASAEAAAAFLRARMGVAGLLFVSALVSAASAYAIVRSLSRQLGGEPSDARELTGAVPLRAGDTSSLMASLMRLQKNLAAVVSNVRQSSDGVATASAQIAQGNQDLSGRTEVKGLIGRGVEPSSGVQQVGEAVSNMDQATQQNAAQVEERAAAAESPKGQAEQLAQAVAVFKLSRDDAAPEARTRCRAPRPGPHQTRRPSGRRGHEVRRARPCNA